MLQLLIALVRIYYRFFGVFYLFNHSTNFCHSNFLKTCLNSWRLMLLLMIILPFIVFFFCFFNFIFIMQFFAHLISYGSSTKSCFFCVLFCFFCPLKILPSLNFSHHLNFKQIPRFRALYVLHNLSVTFMVFQYCLCKKV